MKKKRLLAAFAALALTVGCVSSASAGSTIGYLKNSSNQIAGSATGYIDGYRGEASTLSEYPQSNWSYVQTTVYYADPEGGVSSITGSKRESRGAATKGYTTSGRVTRVQSFHECQGAVTGIWLNTY